MHWVVYKSLFPAGSCTSLSIRCLDVKSLAVSQCGLILAHSRVLSCLFHLSNGHGMGQRIKLIVLVQRARLFPTWSILHGQRVMLLPFSKSKSSPRQPGRGPQGCALDSTSYTYPAVPRSHAALSPLPLLGLLMAPYLRQHGPHEVPGTHPHLTHRLLPWGPPGLQSSSAALNCIYFSVQL